MLDLKEQIAEVFPDLCERDLIDKVESKAKVLELKAGTVIMDLGSFVKVIPLVLDGLVKVLREDDEGNELFLYYLNPGETCAMSLNCCSANKPSEIRAVLEEDSTILAIPSEYIEAWMMDYKGWKNLIFNTYHRRFHELLQTIDNIAFMKMDERLLNYLQAKSEATHSTQFQITHQKVAEDLNTSREVVSRLLKQLEKLGKIELGRNKISLIVT